MRTATLKGRGIIPNVHVHTYTIYFHVMTACFSYGFLYYFVEMRPYLYSNNVLVRNTYFFHSEVSVACHELNFFLL